MPAKKATFMFNVPTPDEFAGQFPQYGPRARDEGKEFFEIVMRPESFLRAVVVTDVLELPAVAGIAKQCSEMKNKKLADIDKQFVGALVCSLMKTNGYRKKGLKRSIPHPNWSKGEVYELKSASYGLEAILKSL